jgi:hypothetical protein
MINKKLIVLISCVSQKLDQKAKAQDLYISSLFKKNLKYARSLNPDQIFILSAKYMLLELDDEIDPYNVTLNNMKVREVKDWSSMLLSQLKRKTDLNNDEFIFLAGEKYRKYLLPYIKLYQIPMQGLKIGKQLQWLTKQTNNGTGIN